MKGATLVAIESLKVYAERLLRMLSHVGFIEHKWFQDFPLFADVHVCGLVWVCRALWEQIRFPDDIWILAWEIGITMGNNCLAPERPHTFSGAVHYKAQHNKSFL